jgi:AcrR family transcriptional regulator
VSARDDPVAAAGGDQEQFSEHLRRSGRRPGDSGTHELILDAAVSEFAEFGYEKATIRGIARRAEVDPALVHHYFTNKQQLFATAVRLPVDPAKILQEVVSAGPDQIGETLVHALTRSWESEDARRPFISLLRSTVSNEQAVEMVRGFITEALVGQIAGQLGRPHARLRAAMVGAQIVGLAMLRYVIKVEPLAAAPLEQVIPALASTAHRDLTADLGLPEELVEAGPGQRSVPDHAGKPVQEPVQVSEPLLLDRFGRGPEEVTLRRTVEPRNTQRRGC